MRRFLAIGECMVEMAPETDGRYRLGFAGDTFNTAWYMRQLAGPQVRVGYLSAIGDDAMSRRMADFMADAGIEAALAVRPGETIGLYVISLDRGERSFSYWRSASAARHLADDLTDLTHLSPGDMAYVSGITLAILPDAGRRRLISALGRAAANGARVAFDPNLRPALWRDADLMRRRIMEAAGTADIVLPSFDDESAHFGDGDQQATAERYAAAGAATVLVSNGAKDTLVLSGGTVRMIATDPAEDVVDTTAAGDSFNAGALCALAGGASAEEAARRGAAVARQVIAARGALVPLRSER